MAEKGGGGGGRGGRGKAPPGPQVEGQLSTPGCSQMERQGAQSKGGETIRKVRLACGTSEVPTAPRAFRREERGGSVTAPELTQEIPAAARSCRTRVESAQSRKHTVFSLKDAGVISTRNPVWMPL